MGHNRPHENRTNPSGHIVVSQLQPIQFILIATYAVLEKWNGFVSETHWQPLWATKLKKGMENLKVIICKLHLNRLQL